MTCLRHQTLTLTKLDAWTRRDNNKVIEVNQQLREHENSCSICNPDLLMFDLWVGYDVVVGEDIDAG